MYRHVMHRTQRGDTSEATPMARCDICEGPADRCRFARACSCWRGIPCQPARKPILSPFVRRALAAELPAKETVAR